MSACEIANCKTGQQATATVTFGDRSTRVCEDCGGKILKTYFPRAQLEPAKPSVVKRNVEKMKKAKKATKDIFDFMKK